jgi:hypothetical protein
MLKKKEMDTWGWEMIADAKIQPEREGYEPKKSA